MTTHDDSKPEAGLPIGTAILCNDQGSPVIGRLTEDDRWNMIQLQDAEDEPMLRDVA